VAKIPSEELESLKREVDLAALVRSKGIELKPHGGKDLVGLSPFTDEKTPSFIVSPHKNLWHCMSSGQGGSVIDFVMKHDGVSFRHAALLLKEQNPQLFGSKRGPVKKATTAKLSPPVSFDADDQTLLAEVLGYYREALAENSSARAYLGSRGITEEAAEAFGIGYADRTLGLRLPQKNRQDGAKIRERLAKVGIYRETGHEHFNGCVVFPILDAEGQVSEIYGRKIARQKSKIDHLYLPGPHRGIFNRSALESSDLILCESVIDALTFWCAGLKNVTCIWGTEGFTDELFEAIVAAKTRRVYLAYDRDPAGERAAGRDASRLSSVGVECLRVKFPAGQDANQYALSVTPASKSLRLLINSAEWVSGTNNSTAANGTSTTLAANGTHQNEEAAKGKKAVNGTGLNGSTHSALSAPSAVPASSDEPSPDGPPAQPVHLSRNGGMTQLGEDYVLALGDPSTSSGHGREYRIRGLHKNGSLEVLKVNLRLKHGDLFHLDEVNFYQAKSRQGFVAGAAAETNLRPELIKRDLGKLLLLLEERQQERLAELALPQADEVAPMSDEEREEALAFLRSPGLMDKLLEDVRASGVVGEETNVAAAWLACSSRLLNRPLAVIIQSTSAAGKSTLMEAVLKLMPSEAQIKYSAMTGQSLYYLGETNLKHKILAIVEEEGAERASYALKLLQSEGELTIASTGKNPESGRMETQEYHVEGPVMIFLTTTAIDIDEELLNRCLVLTVDEGHEQTRRIHQRQREARTEEGVVASERRKAVIKRHQNVQRLLKPYRIINDFAQELTFACERTRSRRDHEKYLTLIDSVTLAHQHQRQVETLNIEGHPLPCIRATLEDIAIANRLAAEILGRSLDELPPQTRRFLGQLQAMVKAACQEKELEPSDFRFTRAQARAHTGMSHAQVKLHLDRLEELEYVRSWSLNRVFEYELLINPDHQGDKHLIGLLDVKELRHRYDAALSDSK